MATSSITKNFYISGKEEVEIFINALEASANDAHKTSYIELSEVTDKSEVKALFERMGKNLKHARNR